MSTNRNIFLQHIAQTSDFPLGLEIEHAKGVWMYGFNGQKYLDLISGIGVSNVGHCHPKIVEAVKNQVEKYMHLMVYGEYVQTPQIALARAITSTLPPCLDSVYLVNSGSEATEGALKLAKRYTGRSKIISAKSAYHGSTHASLSLSDSEEFTQPFRPLLPNFYSIAFNCLDSLQQIDENTAAIMIETIQGEAGVVTPKNDYLKAVRERCDETGTLLILDEVQCGAGRTGRFWAFQHYGIIPDILTTAKGIGGGMPIGAFIASKEVMSCLTHHPILGHITTFGGHPVSAAAAAACIEVMLTEKLTHQADAKAELIKSLLVHPAIFEIRNKGLMMAVQLDSFENLQKVIHSCISKGLVTDWFLYNNTSMRIAPPLIITDEEIKIACTKILEALDEVYK